jgi:hypothetical protein
MFAVVEQSIFNFNILLISALCAIGLAIIHEPIPLMQECGNLLLNGVERMV